MRAVIEDLSPDALARERLEKRMSALAALTELVDGPAPREKPRVINDAPGWVHTAFYTYRSGMPDNGPALTRVARIEHDFIAALSALNFDDQKQQLRRALTAMRKMAN